MFGVNQDGPDKLAGSTGDLKLDPGADYGFNGQGEVVWAKLAYL